MKKRNISAEDKLQVVLEYLNGHGSQEAIAKRYGAARTPFRKWIAKYKVFGNSAFIRTDRTTAYCAALKQDVIKAYLTGEGSYEEIAIKYRKSGMTKFKKKIEKAHKYELLSNSVSNSLFVCASYKIINRHVIIIGKFNKHFNRNIDFTQFIF